VKILVSWSSGKDSAWMLHVLQRDHPGAAAALLTSVNVDAGRVSMHGVREEVLAAQASAAGLPLRVVPLPWPCSNAIYEQRMRRAVDDALSDGFTHVAFGDLFLEDVRRYRETRLEGTGLAPLFPLWGEPTASLAAQMIAGGLRATIVCLDPRVMPRALIGASFDEPLLARLPASVDPCGERGEFHTCITAGPMFAHPIAVSRGRIVERDGFLFGDLALAESDSQT
jgi:diphthamide synthase (EF-2-diphthine--ammonia ligase)